MSVNQPPGYKCFGESIATARQGLKGPAPPRSGPPEIQLLDFLYGEWGDIGQASVGSAYGAAGSMVVLLVWVYYSALIFFFGAEYTHAWGTRHHAVVPQPHAMPGVAPQTKSAVASEHATEP